MKYRDYIRALDEHGVLHLARLTDYVGHCLCGWPPVGTRMTDPIMAAWPPGVHVTLDYRTVCSRCNDCKVAADREARP